MGTKNSKKENSKTNNIIKENAYFKIVYKPNKDKTKIFNNGFINKNKDKCKIIYKNKEFDLKKNILKILIIIKIKKMKFHLY